MKKFFGLILSGSILLTACGDGVPRVNDPHHIVDANGQPMKCIDFIKKYCIGKDSNETCAKVRMAVSMDSTKTKGGLPGGW